MKKRAVMWALVAAAALAIPGLAYFAGVVSAEGVPTTEPLVYSGLVLNGGAPDTAPSRTIVIQLFDAPTAGIAVCVAGPRSTPLTHGRFRFVLDDPDCITAVHDHADLWVQVTVDATTLPRTHIGAVPYALEADRVARAVGGETMSMTGLYCDRTAPMTGNVGGYMAARRLCQATANCGPSARACSVDEMARSAALMLVPTPLEAGRVTGGSVPRAMSGAPFVNDCVGFTDGGSHLSQIWAQDGAQGYASIATCDVSMSIFCCE